jgi:hypothetical protein
MADTPVRPVTTSRFYVEFDGLTEKLIKSVQEIAFQGQVKGYEKALASTKGGKTLRQSTSTGFEENPNFTIEVYLRCRKPCQPVILVVPMRRGRDNGVTIGRMVRSLPMIQVTKKFYVGILPRLGLRAIKYQTSRLTALI